MEKPSTARIALKWGIITSVLMMIYTVIMFVTILWQNPIFALVPFFFLLMGIILALRDFKSLNNSFLSFGEGLGVGTLVSAIIGLITSNFSYFYARFIDTTINQQTIDFERKKLETQGTLSQEKINAIMETYAPFFTPGARAIINLFLLILIGFIFSLIVSAVLKKDKPEMNF